MENRDKKSRLQWILYQSDTESQSFLETQYSSYRNNQI